MSTRNDKDLLPVNPEPGDPKPGYLPVADMAHKPRVTDTDPKAARRAERQVAGMFLLSMLSEIGRAHV